MNLYVKHPLPSIKICTLPLGNKAIKLIGAILEI